MEYSDDLLREALPTRPPPFELVPSEVLAEIERGSARDDDFEHSALVARSAQWTYAMFNELRLGRYYVDGPIWTPALFCGHFAIGLFDADDEPAGFGLILFVRGLREAPFIESHIIFERLGEKFPILHQQASITEHRPPHPQYATSASWARCDRDQRWGVLTAGHAVGTSRGAPVSLSHGLGGIVARSYHPVIDAAFVHTDEAPSSARMMTVRRFPAAGNRVSVGCQSGGEQRHVVAVEDNMGVVKTLSRAAILYMDRCCSPGDSGALVKSGDDAVGIYLGSLETEGPNPDTLGRVLSFEQAAYALEVTAYE